MPEQLVPYLHQTNYDYLMGLAGLISGALVWMIWSKGI